MNLFKSRLNFCILIVLFSIPSLSHASCAMGTSVKGTSGALSLAIDPRAAVGDILAYRYSKGFSGQTLVIGCTGSSPYRSASLLTASSIVSGAFDTGIPGVGVIIGDLYNTAMKVPYSISLSPNALTPWGPSGEVRLTYVKTGPITPGTVGTKVYANYYLNSSVFTSLTVSSLTVSQKSCLVDVNSQTQTINLGSPRRSEFTGVGSSAASSERKFDVVLQCEANNIPVQVSFDPAGSSSGNGMLAIDTGTSAAGGVAVEVLDVNRKPLVFSVLTTYHNSSETVIKIPLIAHYKQVGKVTPGAANAAMTFTITQN